MANKNWNPKNNRTCNIQNIKILEALEYKHELSFNPNISKGSEN